MSKIKEERIKDLERSMSTLRYKLKYIQRAVDRNEDDDDRSMLRQTEQVLLSKITCGVVGHTLKLESAFVNKKDDNWRHGNFVCTNCFLKVMRRLTDEEICAAKQLGIL